MHQFIGYPAGQGVVQNPGSHRHGPFPLAAQPGVSLNLVLTPFFRSGPRGRPQVPEASWRPRPRARGGDSGVSRAPELLPLLPLVDAGPDAFRTAAAPRPPAVARWLGRGARRPGLCGGLLCWRPAPNRCRLISIRLVLVVLEVDGVHGRACLAL